jgi:hypothetical protein
MKTLTFYQCEVCNSRYTEMKDAILCEVCGPADETKFPIGLMFEYYHNEFVGIFAVATCEHHSDGHILQTSYWAVRRPGLPRYSLGNERCGGDLLRTDPKSLKHWIKHHAISADKIDTSEFKEMVEFLKDEGIKPIYYAQETGELIELTN